MSRSAIVALAATVALVLAVGTVAYRQFLDVKSHASLAEANLREAQAELRILMDERDFSRINQARERFSEARKEFTYINSRLQALGPLYSLAEALPLIGLQAQAASRLTRAGLYVAEAGEEACLSADVLMQAIQEGDGQEITQVVFDAIPATTAHLSRSLAAVDRAQEHYRGLSKEGLHPILAEALTELDNQVPRQRALLQSSLDLMRVLPSIMGKDSEKTYLMLVQDSGELRPTGGFIGNYGIIRFRDGKKIGTFFNDVYRLDWPYYYAGKSSPPVAMFARYLPESTFWALRDSNIWPNFGRSARQAAWFAIEEGAAEKIDGVIGITHDIVQPIMKIVGSIDIPEYGERVDQSNILDKIRFYQTTGPTAEQRENLGLEPGNNRKFFTSLVLKAVVDRLTNLDMDQLAELAGSVQESIRSKALQVYFTDPGLQELVEAYDVAGSMKESAGDYLWAIDMNLSAAKDNMYVKQSISYTVSLSPTDGVLSEVTLLYDYSMPGKLYTGTIVFPYYADYLRLYVPPGSKLLNEHGTDEPAETFNEPGKTVFGTFVKVPLQSVKEVRLRYWAPLKLLEAQGKIQYELLVQKQAGNNLQSFEVLVLLPQDFSVDDPGPYEKIGDALRYRGKLVSDIHLVAKLSRN